MHNTGPLIDLQDVTKIYRSGEQGTQALRGVSLTIHAGEFVAIAGPSGSGKSTLMHIIGLLDSLTSGTYLLHGLDVSRISRSRQAEIRNREIGFVFQQFNLLPRTTVLGNVLLPTVYGSLPEPVRRAQEVIAEVGLRDRIGYRSNQLSGGEMQRTAIARALIMEPSLLLADEPTGNLDSVASREIMDLFTDANRKGTTVVLITHEREIAQRAQRIVEMRDGRIAQVREAAEYALSQGR